MILPRLCYSLASDETKIVTVSEVSPGTWRVMVNGKPLRDNPGFQSREAAERDAKSYASSATWGNEKYIYQAA